MKMKDWNYVMLNKHSMKLLSLYISELAIVLGSSNNFLFFIFTVHQTIARRIDKNE